jgi:hypothetical protein
MAEMEGGSPLPGLLPQAMLAGLPKGSPARCYGKVSMLKKMMKFNLLVVSAAVFAMPVSASATPLHISSTGAFTVKGGAWVFSTTSGVTITCGEVSGSGTFSTTTKGSMQLKLGPTCTTTLFGVTDHCQSESQVDPPAATETGIIRLTPLTFDLITNTQGFTTVPAILITPVGIRFADIECETIFGTSSFAVEGAGVIGRISSPACGGKSASVTLDFNATLHGVQELDELTGSFYHLSKSGEEAALNMEATMAFSDGVSRTLTCT